jgi:hypothetical protein
MIIYSLGVARPETANFLAEWSRRDGLVLGEIRKPKIDVGHRHFYRYKGIQPTIDGAPSAKLKFLANH